MREIKFRAWQSKMGVMLYSATREGNEQLFDTTLKSTSAHYSKEIKVIHDAVLCESEPDMGYYGGGYWDELFTDECEYMQFTGLKDMNGKEIYEGDTVECTITKADWSGIMRTFIATVERDICNPCFVLKQKDGSVEYDFIMCGLMILEVIGNIHEKELITHDKGN